MQDIVVSAVKCTKHTSVMPLKTMSAGISVANNRKSSPTRAYNVSMVDNAMKYLFRTTWRQQTTSFESLLKVGMEKCLLSPPPSGPYIRRLNEAVSDKGLLSMEKIIGEVVAVCELLRLIRGLAGNDMSPSSELPDDIIMLLCFEAAATEEAADP
mmetsp:Transcript_24345/g.56553  ORF Transcript_24345/g.56553 Transcript_24345/m.56553 type:complete len:155 (-) Transcript_24345:332-796(-)